MNLGHTTALHHMQEPGATAQLDPAVDLNEFAAQKLLTPQEVEDLVFSVSKAGFGKAVTAAELTVYLAADPLLITVRDDKGWTPLLWAAFHGHTLVCRFCRVCPLKLVCSCFSASFASLPQVVAVMLDNGGDGRYRSWMEEMKSDQMEVKGAASDAPASFPVNSPLHWASFKVRRSCYSYGILVVYC